MPVSPSLSEVLELALRAELAEVYTAIPGKVERYTASSQVVDVRPQIRIILDDDEGGKTTETLPLLQNVPVLFQSAGPYSITFPIEVGATGMIVFAMHSIGEWRKRGILSDPGDRRLHSVTGATFYPGLRPTPSPIADGNDDALTIAGPKIRLGSVGATNPAPLFNELKAWLETHTHPTGVGPSGVPIQAGSISTIASSKVSLE